MTTGAGAAGAAVWKDALTGMAASGAIPVRASFLSMTCVDGGNGAAAVIRARVGKCITRMALLLLSPMYRAPLTASTAIPQGSLNDAAVPTPSTHLPAPEPAIVVTTPPVVVMRRMRLLS